MGFRDEINRLANGIVSKGLDTELGLRNLVADLEKIKARLLERALVLEEIENEAIRRGVLSRPDGDGRVDGTDDK